MVDGAQHGSWLSGVCGLGFQVGALPAWTASSPHGGCLFRQRAPSDDQPMGALLDQVAGNMALTSEIFILHALRERPGRALARTAVAGERLPSLCQLGFSKPPKLYTKAMCRVHTMALEPGWLRGCWQHAEGCKGQLK